MPHILHILKDPGNARAIEVIRAHGDQPDVTLSVVLAQEARRLGTSLPGRVYRLQDGHEDSPTGPDTIGPAQLLDLIFAADSVVTW